MSNYSMERQGSSWSVKRNDGTVVKDELTWEDARRLYAELIRQTFTHKAHNKRIFGPRAK